MKLDSQELVPTCLLDYLPGTYSKMALKILAVLRRNEIIFYPLTVGWSNIMCKRVLNSK
jgi:hypothetical protein